MTARQCIVKMEKPLFLKYALMFASANVTTKDVSKYARTFQYKRELNTINTVLKVYQTTEHAVT